MFKISFSIKQRDDVAFAGFIDHWILNDIEELREAWLRGGSYGYWAT